LRIIFTRNLEFILENYVSYNSYIEYMKQLSRKEQLEVFYDIGSNKGEWSDLVSKIFSKSDFHLFEANPIHKINSKRDRFEDHFVVLSSKQSELVFYSKGETGDSYYPEINKIYTENERKLVKTDTLDNYVLANKLPLPDFIKLDTQGSELDILHGGISTLRNCKYLLIEISILDYNKGSPNFSEYIRTLDTLNFYPIKLVETHFTNGKLTQLDLLFSRKP